MPVATRSSAMERKTIRISNKRQITIPQKYYEQLGFEGEAECVLRGSELIIRPVSKQGGGEFAEQILADLLKEGYTGDELLAQFKAVQRKVRPAVEKLIADADVLASSEGTSPGLDDLFGTED